LVPRGVEEKVERRKGGEEERMPSCGCMKSKRMASAMRGKGRGTDHSV
jgi:hypothetical protein